MAATEQLFNVRERKRFERNAFAAHVSAGYYRCADRC